MMNNLNGSMRQQPGMEETARHPVKSVEKTIGIVELLKERRTMPLREIAAELRMNKSTVHNHVSTLREQEYVVKEDGEYALSLKFLHIGGVLRNGIDLYDVAKPHVDQLAADTDELVTLATHERGLGVVLYRSKGENAVDIDTHVGSQVPLHNSALGKAILGHLPRSRVETIIEERGLPAETANTITDEETLMTELEEIKDRGCALDDEEKWNGLRCVAAPILTDDGSVHGAISLSAPKNRLETDAARTDYIEKILNTANLVNLSITYS